MSFFLKKTKQPSHDVRSDEVTNIHCMVDIETMGTRPDSPVITIGAVLFDPQDQDNVDSLEKRGFLRRIDIADSFTNSGGVDPDTLKWWLQQDDAAIKELVNGEFVSLKQALIDFRNYCVDRAPQLEGKFFPGHTQYPIACALWAKSPDFDCKILESACRAVGESMPMRFYQYRCVRTLQDLAWPDGPDSRPTFAYGTAHDARADAVNQALMVQAGYMQLGLSKSDVTFSTF